MKPLKSSEERNHHTIPILALTASAFDSEQKKCFEAGINDYLSKPFKAAALFTKISEQVGLVS